MDGKFNSLFKVHFKGTNKFTSLRAKPKKKKQQLLKYHVWADFIPRFNFKINKKCWVFFADYAKWRRTWTSLRFVINDQFSFLQKEFGVKYSTSLSLSRTSCARCLRSFSIWDIADCFKKIKKNKIIIKGWPIGTSTVLRKLLLLTQLQL